MFNMQSTAIPMPLPSERVTLAIHAAVGQVNTVLVALTEAMQQRGVVLVTLEMVLTS